MDYLITNQGNECYTTDGEPCIFPHYRFPANECVFTCYDFFGQIYCKTATGFGKCDKNIPTCGKK